MKNNQTKDYDDDISFNVVNKEYPQYEPPSIEYLRDTNKINNDDEQILKNIQDKKEQENDQNDINNLNELNDIANINHQHLISTQAFLDALNNDTLRYSLQTQDVQSNRHYALPFISILFLFGLAVWLIINAPMLPPAAVQVGKYYVFSPEIAKIKIESNNKKSTNQKSENSPQTNKNNSLDNKVETKHTKSEQHKADKSTQ